MISILLPTRNRPDHLKQAVRSLLQTVTHPSTLEILIRVDFDAPTDLELPAENFVDSNVFVIRGERFGYGGMHKYFNELAQKARGDFLLTWNDDLEMISPGWDEMLISAFNKDPLPIVQFMKRDINDKADDTLPLLPRIVYEAMGHMSLHCYVDTWISRVTEATGIRRFREDVIFHHHRLQDQTAKENQTVVPTEHPRFEQFGLQQFQDTEKIRKMLAAYKK